MSKIEWYAPPVGFTAGDGAWWDLMLSAGSIVYSSSLGDISLSFDEILQIAEKIREIRNGG